MYSAIFAFIDPLAYCKVGGTIHYTLASFLNQSSESWTSGHPLFLLPQPLNLPILITSLTH